MLRIAKQRETWQAVKISVPKDYGVDVHEVKFLFKLLKAEEIAALALGVTFEQQSRTLETHVAGWEGLGDESGAALPFTEENCRAVIAEPYIQRALATALIEASQGIVAKNSVAGSAS